MTLTGVRGFAISVLAIFAVITMWLGSLWLRRSAPGDIDWLMLGMGVGLALGIALSPSAAKGAIEWWSRSRDQSTIADQVRAEKGEPK